MDKIGINASPRVKKLRERMLTTPEICIERGYLLTESYKETENYPAIIRKAKALAKILKEMTIRIEDGELIVGTVSSKPRAGALTPELNSTWYLKEMEVLSTRDWDKFSPLTEEDKEKMKAFLPYWKGKSLTDKWYGLVPKEAQRLTNKIQSGGAFCVNNQYYGHISVAYEKVLSNGLNGIRKQVDEELAGLNIAKPADLDKFHFLTAINITLDAAAAFAKRYADLATMLADKTADMQRKAELREIAEICEWVPANPARNFHEALQSIWFTYVVLMIEGWGTGIGFLRTDQYLYPFYKRDIESGRITKEEARELLALLYIKMNGGVIPYPTEVVKVFGGFSLAANITLGGLTKDGKNAVNELSYLFLDAEKDVG
ncbi:MAG TPA: pyruvate formate lyase family protein, partial [Spirochaetia bacterium]|nr:pyruvate formate lyase family protein [Spirochaetia bacterium]